MAERTVKFVEPILSTHCYACDAGAVGVTRHNGSVKAACQRHSDPTIPAAFDLCIYCNTPTRKGSVMIDSTDPAHAKCYREACND